MLYLMVVALTVLVSGIWNTDATIGLGLGLEMPVNGLIRDIHPHRREPVVLVDHGARDPRGERVHLGADARSGDAVRRHLHHHDPDARDVVRRAATGHSRHPQASSRTPDGHQSKRPVSKWLAERDCRASSTTLAYLVFFNLAGGDAQTLMGPLALTLLAISAGAVFMGAKTYIGNAPNFMVRSICEEHGIKMPSFIGYMLWSGAILLPLFALITWVWFCEALTSAFEPGENRLKRRDRLGLVVLLQVEQDLEAVGLLANHGAFAGEVVIEAKHLVAADRLGEALDLDRRLFLDRHVVLDQGIGLVAEQDAVDLRIRLETRGQVHGAADDGVVHAVVAAEIADRAIAGVDADAEMKGLLGAEFQPLGLQLAEPPQHGDGHAHASPRILLHPFRFRIAKKHHDGVADIFVDGGAVLKRNVRHLGEVAVEQIGEVLGFQLVGGLGEIDRGIMQGGLKHWTRILLASAAIAVGAGQVSAETLIEAMVSAYSSNPTLQAERARQRGTTNSFRKPCRGWRPTVNTEGSIANVWSDSSTTPATENDPKSVAIGLSQPVFRGFKTIMGTKAAEANVEAGKQSLLAIEQDILFQAIQAYMNVIRDRQIVGLRQQNVSVLNKQLTAADERFKVGEITRTDVAQSRARVSGAQSNVASANATLAASVANYINVVGHKPGSLKYPGLPNFPGL